MDKTNEATFRREAEDIHIVVLGVASVATQGGSGNTEPHGRQMGVGISED